MDLTEISYKCRLRPGCIYNNVKQISKLYTGHIPIFLQTEVSDFHALLLVKDEKSSSIYQKVPNIAPFPPRTFFLLCIFPEVTIDKIYLCVLTLASTTLFYTFQSFLNSFFLATYFNAIMFMVAASVVTTILILNYHHRNQQTHTMPYWVRLPNRGADTIILTLLNRYLADHLFQCQQMSILI